MNQRMNQEPLSSRLGKIRDRQKARRLWRLELRVAVARPPRVVGLVLLAALLLELALLLGGRVLVLLVLGAKYIVPCTMCRGTTRTGR